MARNKTGDGRTIYQRAPRQAYRLFGFDGDRFDGGKNAIGTPRAKFLFLVRFKRGTGDGNPATWENGLQFAVKRLDRPRVSFETQTLNQYNKKRIVQTGIKYGPSRIEFHDTADQAVMRMWHEYAAFYFGDFRKANASDWNYDLVNPDFKNSGEGFGLTLPKEDIKTQTNFFSTVECYQFSGGSYTQFDLVNPKIASFDPDEMDYGSEQGHGLTMTLEFETIIYHNDSKPVDMKSDGASTFVKSLLTDPRFTGDVNEPINSTVPGANSMFPDVLGNWNTGLWNNNRIPNIEQQLFGSSIKASNSLFGSSSPLNSNGVLGAFGSFNFGSIATTVTNSLNVPGRLNQALNKVVGGTPVGQQALSTVMAAVGNPINKAVSGISSSLYDVASGAAQKIATGGSPRVASSQFTLGETVKYEAVGTMTPVEVDDNTNWDDWLNG